jgi:Mor family transcriptional regulator
MAAQYPEILLDTAAHVALVLERLGIEPEKADEVGFSVGEYLRKHWGGRYLYFAKGDLYDVKQEHAEAYEAWLAGAKVEDIATARGWSTRWTRAVLQEVRKARRQRTTSNPLFPELDPEAP